MQRVNCSWPTNRKCKIAIVGEAPGQQEAVEGAPFVGPSGAVVEKIMRQLGFKRSDVLLTNVFGLHPPANNIKTFFMTKAVAKKSGWSKECAYGPQGATGYVKPVFVSELDRLKAELEETEPTVILCLGAVALWALTGLDGISKFRGSVVWSTLYPKAKVVATYHPANIMRGNWNQYPHMASDFGKAVRHADIEGIPKIRREIWIAPKRCDMDNFFDNYIADSVGVLAYDIETIPDAGIITCIGFAPSPLHSIVIPFHVSDKSNHSYWDTHAEEMEAWEWVDKVCRLDVPKVAHNSLYDLTWLYKYGIKVRGDPHDTMLMHHALQPEVKKDLGSLVATYLDVTPWKSTVSFTAAGQNKKDA